MSSHTVAPSRDTLRLTIHPYADHVSWDLMRLSFTGAARRGSFIAHGQVPVEGSGVEQATARSLLTMVLAGLPLPPKASAPPLGDMGEQLTLDLDLMV